MLYQCNLLLTIALVPFCFFFLVNYIKLNADSIFFWKEQECGKGPEGSGCLDQYLAGPVGAVDPNFLQVLREEYLEPPPEDYNVEPFSIYTPVWRKLVDWYQVQESLRDVWQYQAPGFFVEIGAVDGDFMSQTLYLEKNLSWTGLLIEPDPRSYILLKDMQRNAWTSPLCIAMDFPGLKRYWIRTLEEDLPHHFLQILLARSKLNVDTMVGDEERGTTVWNLCAPLSSLLLAGNFTSIDMLTIGTGYDKDEEKIADVLRSSKIDVKTILIQFPTTRFYEDSYPAVKGYIMAMEYSTLLIKYYVKKSHCKLIQSGKCKMMKFYDSVQACKQYFCLDFLNVWTYDMDNLSPIKVVAG